jgi:hypothetical protein
MDISGLLGNTGVALEAEAYKQFGAAVNDKVGGMLGSVFGNKGTGTDGTDSSNAAFAAANAQPGVWDPTPYASAIGGFEGGYNPKNKFLFKVNFEFDPTVSQMASSMGYDTMGFSKDLTFIIKSIDLPKVDFDYELVNMYNFKTKVLKGISHTELNLMFYDDVANHALSFVNLYMQILSPITRNILMPQTAFEEHSLAFNEDYHGLDTSTRSALIGNSKNIISRLTIFQYYVENGNKDLNSVAEAVKLNEFVFTNPRLTKFDLNDQDHEEGGAANTISAIFDYDALHIHTGMSALHSQDQAGAPAQLGKGDILSATEEIAAILTRSASNPAGKTMNPFVSILARQGQRLVQDKVGGFLSKSLGGVAGGALQGAISNVSGALGNAASGTLGNIGSGIAAGISSPTKAPVVDNAGPGGGTAIASGYTNRAQITG